MPLIVLMVPRSATAVTVPRPASATPGELTVDMETLPFVAGECLLQGYENMMLIDQVEWDTEIEEANATDWRRTVHAPEIEAIKITRRMDRGSGLLVKMALLTQITALPWELYFFRPTGVVTADGSSQVRFMTMKLHNPLIAKYSVELGEDEPRESLEISATIIEWVYDVTLADQTRAGHKSIKYDVQLGQISTPSWTNR